MTSRDKMVKDIMKIPYNNRVKNVKWGEGKDGERVNINLGVYYYGMASFWIDRAGVVYRKKPSDSVVKKSIGKLFKESNNNIWDKK